MAYRYLGTGEFYSGVPARDLSAEEFAALPAELQAVVSASPLYAAAPPGDPAADPPPAPAAMDSAPNTEAPAGDPITPESDPATAPAS